MIKRFLLVAVGILLMQSLFADIPTGYYDSATGDGYTLKTQLYNIIKGHNAQGYGDLYDAYVDGDTDPDDGYVWDMYSENPGGTDPYNYEHYVNNCGNYTNEGDCLNREHLFPQGVFSSASPMKTDYHHVVPSDGKVNGMRSSYPFGEVGTASWTSQNGSKKGSCSYSGYSGTVFEPIDEYKGDIARSMLYFATRYEDKVASWSHTMINGTSDQVYTDWFLSLLLDWHNQDPVSQKELTRNDVGYTFQGNRNPFIDHPEYVAQIWGGEVSNNPPSVTDVTNSPTNPSSSETVNITATITDSDGTISNAELHWGLSSGSLSSTIIMSISTGDTYSSNSDIPAQTDGTTVYYEIEAIDDSSDVTTTSVYTYIVDDNPSITILSEDFTTCPASEWTTYSVAGSGNWGCGTNDMQVNAYGSDVACDDWLISPVLDLDSYDNEVLTFTSFTKYNDTYYPTIEVKYSTDYSGSGDPSSASWTDLTATWPAENSEAWTGSGDIDLSSITGNAVYIAFQYTSSGTSSGTSALWEIDDVLVKGIESTSTNEAPVISDISNSPVSPTEEEDVTISATITDSDGTISFANIKWGTSTGNYPNTVSMSNTEDVYSGVIPSQPGGTTVYYIIEATDDEPETTQSGENSFSFTAIPNELPEISGITIDPTSPTEEDDVTVSATITDSDGTISSANIKWGTSTGNYPNTVSMTNSGDAYSGIIPSQPGGTTVYYIIEATDDEPETTQSGENSFSFTAIPNELPEISGITIDPTSPTEEDDVTVSATIIDSDGTISSANIKWGTSTGNYPNTVSMTNSGDTYSGIISAQAAGTTVYYIIEATDDEPETTQSGEKSFSFYSSLPEITNISSSPISPVADGDVTVSSTITDFDGTISLAEIKWGTAPGSYLNTVSMTNSGDDYSGIIPGQAGGTTVYYVIEATDNDSKFSRSSEYNFSFNTAGNILPEVTNVSFNPTIPESTESVNVSATITDSDGTIVTAKIKWGLSIGNYTNNVSMTADGNTYSGSIPAQADEAHVYFVIYTVDNDGGSEQSSENDYIVDDPNVLPEITNVIFNPTDPESTESVSVSATIIDSDGTISSATVKWGTISGIYNNNVNMSADNDVYSGTIPALSDGTHVYFIIYTEDNEGGTFQSPEQDYTVDNPNVLPEITSINFSPTNPESTESVNVSATITDSDGTIVTAKIKWGLSIGNYTNNVSMTADGNTYSGSIPAQVDEAHVYFVVYTVDNDGGSAQSSEHDYIVDNPNVLPEITNVIFNPTDPESTESVSVSATIIDSDGTISSATVKWGTTPGIYNNNVSMNADNDVYSGTIPALSDGTHVYFIIHTVDNEGGTFQSPEQDYTVDNPNVLPEITSINFSPTNPESTESVSVSATITDSDGTISSAQIKWGLSVGNYTNNVSMSASADTYSGVIPAQANGAHVYFVIYAEDNESESSQSTENDYIVSDPVVPVISDVTISPENPTKDDNVTISAIASDSDGTIESVVLKWERGTGTYTDVSMNLSGDKYYGQISKQTIGETIYFTVVATDNDALQGTSEGSYEISESSGINDLTKNSLKVYPNPTSDKINIEIDGSGQINSIKIYNLIGEKVLEINDLNTVIYTVELDTYPKGIYILQIDNSQNTIVRKIMLK